MILATKTIPAVVAQPEKQVPAEVDKIVFDFITREKDSNERIMASFAGSTVELNAEEIAVFNTLLSSFINRSDITGVKLKSEKLGV
jgi:hypothetical protein